MFCLKCGKPYQSGAKFCTKCGAPILPPDKIISDNTNGLEQAKVNPVNVPVVHTRNEKTGDEFPWKVCLIGDVLIVVIVLLMVGIVNKMGKKAAYQCLSSESLQYTYGLIDGETKCLILTNDGNIIVNDTYDFEQSQQNLDQTVLALLNKNHELIVVTKDGIQNVAENVVSFVISDDGTGIAYINELKNNGGYQCGTLSLYDISDEKNSMIASDVLTKNIVISPDGDTVVYVVNHSNDEYSMAVSRNQRESETLGKGKVPIAVADDGDYIYYTNDQKLFVLSGESQERLTSEFDGELMLNNEHTEVMFIDDEACYISTKGSERQKFYREINCTPLLADNVCVKNSILDNVNSDDYLYIHTYGIDSFMNKVYSTSDGYYYINSELEQFKVTSNDVVDIHISMNGEKVLYFDYDSIYAITDFESDRVPQRLASEEFKIHHFFTYGNMNDVYFVNEDHELIFINRYGENSKIADDVKEENVYVDYIEDCIYFLVDEHNGYGTLYYSSSGSKKVKISQADDVNIVTLNGKVYYSEISEEEQQRVYMLVNQEGIHLIDYDE